ncbi:hypothetical protein HRG_013246 [Hirsutella rhossiliensis]
MNVEIQAPIDQNLWRGFFHHLTIPLRGERNALQLQRPLRPAKTRHVVWVGIPAGDGSIRENSFIHVRVCFKDLELFNDHCSPFQTKEDWDARAKPMALRQLQLSDFNWHSQDDETARKQKRDELLDFVLETDTQIRQLKGERFETVHVGARYDCGISPDGHFFVSELTRFTFADTFSGELAPPYDQIIGPLARMIARVLLA